MLVRLRSEGRTSGPAGTPQSRGSSGLVSADIPGGGRHAETRFASVEKTTTCRYLAAAVRSDAARMKTCCWGANGNISFIFTVSLSYPLVTVPKREQLAKQNEFRVPIPASQSRVYRRMALAPRNNNLKTLLLFSEDFFFITFGSTVTNVIFSHISL